MRALVFLPCYTYGGAERQAAILARYLQRTGWDVEVWGLPQLGPERPLLGDLERSGITCRQLPEWPQLDWIFARPGRLIDRVRHALIEWPRQLKEYGVGIPAASFDVAVPFTLVPNLITALYPEKIAARRILWNHRGGYDVAGCTFTGPLIGKIRRRNPVMVANSTAGARYLSDTFQVPSSHVSVVRNVFEPDEAFGRLAGQRTYASLAERPLQLLHVANLFDEKDIWTVLAAIRLVRKASFPCHLHIAGFFPNVVDYDRFRDMVGTHEIGSSVTYHGPIGRGILAELLWDADIGLLSSRSEGAPNSVMEYMYAGLPVIGTDILGIREVVSGENHEWLFHYGDAERLAELIIKLGLDADARRSIGMNNRLRIVDDYSPERLLPEWGRVLECALAGTAG